MPFTLTEGLEDLPAVLSLLNKVEAGVKALPAPADRKAADYATLIGSVLPDLAALIDQVEAQAKS